MRIYSAESLDSLRTLRLLKHWQDDNLLTGEQRQQLQEEVSPDLRTTNLFLRTVMFLFALGILALIQGLLAALLSILDLHGSDVNFAVQLLVSSAACYAAAELAVRDFQLFHFGLEEACVACSIAFLFGGLELHHTHIGAGPDLGDCLIGLVCASVSLWTWHRFGYWYTFLAAMLFVACAAVCLTTSPAVAHTLVALLYTVGLFGIIAAGASHHSDSLRNVFSAAEALLWMGIYFSINLVPYTLFPHWAAWWALTLQGYPPVFYWLTWMLIWCLPPVLLARGIRRRDRVLLVLGAVLLVVTFICNKPYLGWQRHPWDPMLLGLILIAIAWTLQRWLAQGVDGVRNGFTAAPVAGKQSRWMEVGTSAFSLVAPHAGGHGAQPSGTQSPLGQGGASGGGGAGGTF